MSKLILRIMIHREYFEFTLYISTFIQPHTSLSLSRYSLGLRNFPIYVSGEMECGREHIHDRNMSIFYYGQSSNCDFSTSVIVLYFLFRYFWIIDMKTEILNDLGIKNSYRNLYQILVIYSPYGKSLFRIQE